MISAEPFFLALGVVVGMTLTAAFYALVVDEGER